MKTSIVLSLMTIQLLAQQPFRQDFNERFKCRNYFITGEENNIRIETPNGRKRTKMLEYIPQYSLSKYAIDSSGLDVRTLDTSLYSSKYAFWQEIPIGLDISWSPVIGDINKNGRLEVYGIEADYSTPKPAPVTIYELDITQKFKKVHQYPDSVYAPQALVDINNDGNSEIILFGQPRGMVFTKNTPTSFPISYMTKFGLFGSQTDDPTVGDFDNNGKNDILYWSDLRVLIEEYNESINAFDSIYAFYPVKNGLGGFSVGDFDMDGKTDIVFGTVQGDVFVIEAQQEHQYHIVWSSKVETYNAYLHFWTNDIDGNGKPEFWVGGDAFYSGLGITRFTCFESNGNNTYVPVARLDMIGIFSFFAGSASAKDIDGDGRQEIFVCLDQHVFIFTFTGTKNAHQYSLLFAKRNEMAGQNSVYFNAALYDFTNDGRDELLISMGHVIESLGLRLFSRIYTLDVITGIRHDPEMIPITTELFQNYPNPFNSTSSIRFRIMTKNKESVVIKIFNVLGREIKELLNADMENGEYRIMWNGTNNTNALVESGIYFVTMKTPTYSKTIKTVFLK